MHWHDDPGSAVVSRALTVASDRGRGCRPVDLLAALAELEGPIGAVLRAADGGPLFPDTLLRPGLRGGANGYLTAQAIGAAAQFASERGEPFGPAHLLAALVDQGDLEVVAALGATSQTSSVIRSVALRALEAPEDLPPLAMPALTPAGTWDRPALDITELNPDAWASLCWRQQRLPLSRLRRRWQWSALDSLEQGAAWRVANAFQVDDDQRYSLLTHHMNHVEALAHEAHPELVETRQQLRDRYASGALLAAVSGHRRWRRHRLVPNFMVGWPTWFSNRRHGLHVKYLRLITFPRYRGQPGPPSS